MTMGARRRDRGISEAEIADKLGLDTDRVGDIFRATIAPLRKYEKELNKMLKNAEK